MSAMSSGSLARFSGISAVKRFVASSMLMPDFSLGLGHYPSMLTTKRQLAKMPVAVVVAEAPARAAPWRRAPDAASDLRQMNEHNYSKQLRNLLGH